MLKCNRCGEEMMYFETGCSRVNTMYICKCGQVANESIYFKEPVFGGEPLPECKKIDFIHPKESLSAVLAEGWRDARKELPEHDNYVLVYCDGCGGKDYYSLGKYICGQWVDKFDTCVLDAIGWMELPDPPAFT